ncbi:hypothetical protein PUR71_12730 [Streptomyces sp. SP17BM10]|nr:hypothetical protein [Streptomyces sp. SP17BM10]MEE1783764.1 hypothetical protein [Streptomyces sp. SP17BM10]
MAVALAQDQAALDKEGSVAGRAWGSVARRARAPTRSHPLRRVRSVPQ